MKYFIYLLSGVIFGFGLSISGMIDPEKIKSFLAIGTDYWSPALLIVLVFASAIYSLVFYFLRKREKTLNGASFGHPTPRPIDKNLILGAAVFGIGWGIAGICPGPAIVNLASPDINFIFFIIAMIFGFEVQRRMA